MDSNGQTSISVVIPCYNAAPFLGEAIRSALGQTLKPLEVIVVDDGSTDESANVATEFGAPVRVLGQPNQGESVARNRGFDEARGAWIAFLDADDVWAPSKLERQAQLIGADVVCVHTAYYEFGVPLALKNSFVARPNVQHSLAYMGRFPFVNSSSILVRRDARARFPLWTRDAEDLIFYLELLQEGAFALVPEPLTGYRRHSLSQTHRPGAEIRRHAALRQWLASRADDMPPEDIRAIEYEWNNRVVRAGISALARGRFDEFRETREYLRPYCGYWGAFSRQLVVMILKAARRLAQPVCSLACMS